MFTSKDHLLFTYVLAVSMFLPYQLCAGKPTTVSLQVEPSEIKEIDFISSKDDDSPLVLEIADANQNTEIERQDFEEQPEFDSDDMEEFDQNPEEIMDTANALVFRPLFAYRNKNKFSRRSTSQGRFRANRRRSQQGSGTVVANTFGQKPPSYLFYDRKSGAYYPYYYPTSSYGQIRRS